MSAVLNVWRRLPPKAKVGTVLLGLFVLAAIIGPQVAPFDPGFQNPSPSLSLQPPSAAHLLGTTQSGQDVLSQLLVGIRLTLELAFYVGVIAGFLSVVIGVTAAFLGGVWDEFLSLITNVFLVIPALPLLIVLLGYLPQKGQLATIVVLSATGWPWGARVIRAQTLTIRNRDFIAASRESGEKTWRIIAFEIDPERGQPDRGQLRQHGPVRDRRLGGARVHRARRPEQLVARHDALLGAEPEALQLGAWWWFLPPGIAVALIGTSLVLLNTGIDELGNPRLRVSRTARRIEGHRVWGTDPTPVLAELAATRGRVGAFLHSFSRNSLLDETAPRAVSCDESGPRDQRPVGRLPHRGRRRPRGRARSTSASSPARWSAWPGRAARGSRRSPTARAACCARRRWSPRQRALPRASAQAAAGRHPADERPRAAQAALARDRDRVPERHERAQPGAAGQGPAARRHPRAPAAAQGRGDGEGGRAARPGRHPARRGCAATRTSCPAACGSG